MGRLDSFHQLRDFYGFFHDSFCRSVPIVNLRSITCLSISLSLSSYHIESLFTYNIKKDRLPSTIFFFLSICIRHFLWLNKYGTSLWIRTCFETVQIFPRMRMTLSCNNSSTPSFRTADESNITFGMNRLLF